MQLEGTLYCYGRHSGSVMPESMFWSSKVAGCRIKSGMTDKEQYLCIDYFETVNPKNGSYSRKAAKFAKKNR
jgi:hypothetical protein